MAEEKGSARAVRKMRILWLQNVLWLGIRRMGKKIVSVLFLFLFFVFFWKPKLNTCGAASKFLVKYTMQKFYFLLF